MFYKRLLSPGTVVYARIELPYSVHKHERGSVVSDDGLTTIVRWPGLVGNMFCSRSDLSLNRPKSARINTSRLEVTRVHAGSYTVRDRETGAYFDIRQVDGLWRWSWIGDHADDEQRTFAECKEALADYLNHFPENKRWRIKDSQEVYAAVQAELKRRTKED